MFAFLLSVICLILSSAFALFDQCSHKFYMKAGEKLYVNSPYYPNEYPVGTSCRYVIMAPPDYQLKFSCDINLKTPYAATRCQNEVFSFNRDGNELLTPSEYFCGSGKMERKSFLNEAAISYISTPLNKRILTSAIKEAEQNEQMQEKVTTEKIITTTTITSTLQPLKENQLTSETTNITKTTQIPIKTHIKESPLRPISLSSTPVQMTSLPNATSGHHHYKNKNVGNAFAYVVAVLSNQINLKVFARKRTTTTTTTTESPLMSTTLRPTSVSVNKIDFLPANTWRNGSIGQHKTSLQRVAKVIVGQDYTTTSFPTSLPYFSSTSTSLFKHSTRLSEDGGNGGGSFSCLVEVLEPQCECGWSSTVKIAGASGVAAINEFPSMAGILTRKNLKVFCGATIIHRHYLLSAAHCYITPETSRPEFLRAVVGEHDLSPVLESLYTVQYDLVSIITHEQFHVSTAKVHNDIAILKTYLPIDWSRSVAPACLPFYSPAQGEGSIPYAGQRVETAGWGTTSFGGQQSNLLLKTTLDVTTRAECQKIIGNIPFGAFCTYTPGRDTCQYDSGGALYVRGERMYAVGIVSYGFACATNQPSVNTRISSHLKWIRQKSPDAKYCRK